MQTTSPFVPPPPDHKPLTEGTGVLLLHATRQAAAASLAAGIIAASGRPHSLVEAGEIYLDAYHLLFRNADDPLYRQWLAKDRGQEPYR